MNNDTIDLRIKRFQQALHDSKGATNNSFTFDMIKRTDASTEDLVRLGGQIGNEGFYNSYSFPEHEKHKTNADRKRNKELLDKIKTKPLTLRDYSWLFNKDFIDYIPDTIAIGNQWNSTGTQRCYYDGIQSSVNGITGKKYTSDTNAIRVLCFKQALETLASDALPKQALKRMMDDEGYFKWAVLGTYNNTDYRYDIGSLGTRPSFSLPSVYNIHTAEKHIVDNYIKMCVELNILERLMINECFDEINNTYDSNMNKTSVRTLTDIFMGGIHDWTKTDKVSTETAKLFKIVRTYGILLDMGIGMYSYSQRRTTQGHYGRVSTRVRTVYKKFLNAKTVDERKNLRELLLSQLKIIAIDFYGHEYDFAIMPCAQEQDAEFEKSNTKDKTKKADNGSKPAKAQKGQPSGTKIDISKFANATTVSVTAYRTAKR